MPPFIRHVEGHTLTLDAGPTAWLWVLVALCCLAPVVLLVQSERSGLADDWRHLVRGGIALICVGGLVAWVGQDVPAGRAATYFPDALRPASLASGLGVIACVLSALELFLRSRLPPDKRLPALVDLPPILLVGVLAIWLGLERRTFLLQLGPIPQVARVEGCEHVHVGVECSPTVTLFKLGVRTPYRGIFGIIPRWDDMRPVAFAQDYSGQGWEDLQGWHIPPVHVDTHAPGQVRATWIATRSGLQVRTELGPFQVHGRSGDPRLRLEPRTTYRYSTWERWRRRVRFLKVSQVSGEGEELRVRVGEPTLVDGIWQTPISRQVGDGEVITAQLIEEDGLTRFAEGESESSVSWDIRETAALKAQLLGKGESGESLVACETPLVPYTFDCLCDTTAPVGQEAVPVHCASHYRDNRLSTTLIMGALNLLTLGAVGGIAETDRRYTLEAIEAESPPLVQPPPESAAAESAAAEP